MKLVVHREGHAIPMMMNAQRKTYAGGAFHQLAVFVAEDRHRYERELLLARKKAEELLERQRQVEVALVESQAELDRRRVEAEDRARFAEQMVGIVSHDLRNPLSVVHMNAVLPRALPSVRPRRDDRLPFRLPPRSCAKIPRQAAEAWRRWSPYGSHGGSLRFAS